MNRTEVIIPAHEGARQSPVAQVGDIHIEIEAHNLGLYEINDVVKSETSQMLACQNEAYRIVRGIYDKSSDPAAREDARRACLLLLAADNHRRQVDIHLEKAREHIRKVRGWNRAALEKLEKARATARVRGA